MKKRTIIKIIIAILPIILNFILIPVQFNFSPIIGPTDVDEIRYGKFKGDYLISDGVGVVKIMDPYTRQILWKNNCPHFFFHDADLLPNGDVLIADTGGDKIIEINITTNKVVWEWDAKNNSQVNWTDFGLKNGWDHNALSIVQNKNPPNGYYTHLNAVEFINGSQSGKKYDTVLVSIRNFDLLIEINHSAKIGEPGYLNITWHYGIPGNHSLLFHQHSPKRLSNGHTLVCDSENNRVIEIDKNGKLIWEYRDKKLRWVRDCDLLPNGNLLITDSNNNRIIEINKTTKEIVKCFTFGLFTPFDADLTSDGKIIVGNTFGDDIIVYDYSSGLVVDIIGFNYLFAPIFFTILAVIIYQIGNLIYVFKNLNEKSIIKRFRKREVYSKLVIIITLTIFIYFFYYFMAYIWNYGIWHFTESFPRPSI
ncbi:MAG: hypothetical protein ACTSWR_08445 [Candidatus Helarchaeota archaeon]